MKIINKKVIQKTTIFDVEKMELEYNGEVFNDRFRITSKDFVNILAVTRDNKAILIKQPRYGATNVILETPGGLIDDKESDPTLAAVRELEEETGYISSRMLSLGAINSNPAIMNNKMYMFVALNCTLNANRTLFPDSQERIVVETVDVNQLETLVRTGAINHALSGLTIMLALKYLKLG